MDPITAMGVANTVGRSLKSTKCSNVWLHTFLSIFFTESVFTNHPKIREARNPDFFLFTVCSVWKNMQHQILSFFKSRNPDWKDKTWWLFNFPIVQCTMVILSIFSLNLFEFKKQCKELIDFLRVMVKFERLIISRPDFLTFHYCSFP